MSDGADDAGAGPDFRRAGKVCSFCGAPGGPDVVLAGGLGAMICADCVAHLHAELVDSAGARRPHPGSQPPWEAMDDTALLAQLPLVLRSAEQNLVFAQEWVDLLRGRGISWAAIGASLGVSRQAAWERFSRRRPRAGRVSGAR